MLRSGALIAVPLAGLLLAAGQGMASRTPGSPIAMNRVAVLHSPCIEVLAKPMGFDLDHDGKREFAITRSYPPPDDYYSARIEVFESSADNAFQLAHFIDLGVEDPDSAYPADVADLDGDGLGEILIANKDWYGTPTANHSIRVYESPTPSTYPTELAWESLILPGWPEGGLALDGDGDGKSEIAIREVAGKITFYEHVVRDLYSEIASVTIAPPGFYPQSIAVADDLDQDGRPEVINAGKGADSGEVYVIESTGDDSYAVVWSADLLPTTNVTFAVDGGDLDGDGKREFLVGGYQGGAGKSLLFVIEAVGDDTYEVVATLSRPNTVNAYSSAAVADVDGDGRREIVFGTAPSIGVFENVANDTWALIWSQAAGIVHEVGAGDHDGDGKDEIIFREGWFDPSAITAVWEIDPAYAADADGDGRVDAVDNCPAVANPGQQDGDGDAVGDACDNCAFVANAGQGPAVLGQTVLATGRETFGWGVTMPVAYVRGHLASVGVYGQDVAESLPAAASLTDGTAPAAGAGLYWLVKPDCPAGSWQSSPGAEPERDAALP